MKRFRCLALACCMTLVCLLSGCGPTHAGSASSVTREEHSAIVYWSMWESHEPQAHVIQDAINDFTRQTGIPVDIHYNGRAGNREPLKKALESGTVIDIFDEDIDRVPIEYGDYLYNLEKLVKETHYEATAIPPLMEACREAGGGTLTTIPYQPNIFAVFYNQDIFDRLRIKEPPKTWEEFLDVCQTLKTHGIIPFTTDDAYMGCLMGYHLGRLVGEDRVREIVANNEWDDPAVLRFAEDYYNMVKRGYFSPNIGANQFPDAQNHEIATGKAAMCLNGSWVISETAPITGPNFRWGCFSYPELEGGVSGADTANYGAQVFGIHKDSPFKEECFQLITMITKSYFDARLSEASIGIPADLDNPMWPDQLQCVSPLVHSLEHRWSWAAGLETNLAMTPLLRNRIQRFCAGDNTPEEFVSLLLADAQAAASAQNSSGS